MSVEVIMPQMGETVLEGTVNTWHRSAGDQVTEGEPLLEIGTDKVDTEIPAPATGVLSEIRVQPGETVPVATVLAVII
jgi:pyruvate dehydrogenase E2 component (dihydrolipoamide acetyltransferase)